MKKFKLKLVGVLFVCALSILGYARMNHSEKWDDLLLENIEALAANEDETNRTCFGSGSIVCPRLSEGVKHVLYYNLLP